MEHTGIQEGAFLVSDAHEPRSFAEIVDGFEDRVGAVVVSADEDMLEQCFLSPVSDDSLELGRRACDCPQEAEELIKSIRQHFEV